MWTFGRGKRPLMTIFSRLASSRAGDLSYYFGDPHGSSARMAASSALWRAACDELRDAQVAMAEETAILDRAWLRASCPPTRAVRDRLKRAEAAAAHARIAYEHAAAVMAAEEAVALAWTGAEMQRASGSDMAEMMMEGASAPRRSASTRVSLADAYRGSLVAVAAAHQTGHRRGGADRARRGGALAWAAVAAHAGGRGRGQRGGVVGAGSVGGRGGSHCGLLHGLRAHSVREEGGEER